MTDPNTKVADLKEDILKSRKYRDLGLNPDTVEDLIRQEMASQASEKSLRKAVRKKLHNIVAPYLGELDYALLRNQLDHLVFTSLADEPLQDFCLGILSQHASTAERIPNLSNFYAKLFEVTGKPDTLLDLACGLHPFAFPWMGLPTSMKYFAYDIIQPRIDLITHFFQTIGATPLAINQDIFVHPPEIHADLAIFFKEAHRLEKRYSGANQKTWEQLDVDLLAVSLPAQDLAGTHSLIEKHRNLVIHNLDQTKLVSEILIGNELIFIIEKPGK